MYNPQGGNEYEFLELHTPGLVPLDLSGAYFEGIAYTFPSGTTMAPDVYWVLARNPQAFSQRYPQVDIAGSSAKTCLMAAKR